MENFEKGLNYSFEDISYCEQEYDYKMYEYGNNVLGEELIVLKHMYKDVKISFVLVSATSNMYYYDCVYIN